MRDIKYLITNEIINLNKLLNTQWGYIIMNLLNELT